MARMTGPDCAVMCNLINTHTHTHTHTHTPFGRINASGTRMTRMTGPDCAVMCNLINTHTHTERESRARSETAGDGTASSGKVRLGDTSSRQLGPLQRGPGYESRRVFLFRPDLR